MSIETATAIGMAAFGLPILLLLLHPVLTRGARILPVDTASIEVEELLTERERSYTALADLDFDFECGKISERDYETLRSELLQETAAVLGQLDERIAETKGQARPKHRAARDRPTSTPTITIDEDAIEREISRFKAERTQPERDT